MFHFLPIAVRYDGTPPAGVSTATRCTSGRCTPTPGLGEDHVSADPTEKPALRFNYLSTEQDRREWVEAIRAARNILDQPAFAPFNGGESHPGRRWRPTSEILDWVAKDAETALHPSCTCRMGEADDDSVVDPLTMKVHGIEGVRVCRRLGDALRHQRQHLRAGDDDGREGRRPDPRQHPAAPEHVDCYDQS